MKRILALVFCLIFSGILMAQQYRVLRIHNNDEIVFQMQTSKVDSIKSDNLIATIYYGDGSWSRNIHDIDSMTFAIVESLDTTTIIDTTIVDTSAMVSILWTGDDGVEINNPYAGQGVDIQTNGDYVTITSTAGISNLTYHLSGTSDNGSLTLNTDKKFIIFMENLSLVSHNGPAINIKDNKKGVLHVEGNNTLRDDESNTNKACVYSKGELVKQGSGSMDIKSFAVNGLQGKNGVCILAGTTSIEVIADASKGIKTDSDVIVNGGVLNITASGNLTIDTLADGSFDKSYCSGIKADGSYVQNGGNIQITLPASNKGGKGISTSGEIIINEGNLNIDTHGAGECLGGSGTAALDGYVNACIKADSNIHLLGGNITMISDGKGGRGICSDRNLYVGQLGADNDILHIYVQTSGATVNPTNSNPGGWWGQGSTSDADYFKGIAKAIRIEGNIYINSGKLQAYCSQTSGDPTGEAIESKDSIFINGGDIEANAYDDAINGTNYLEINGGRVWAYSRGNDGIDCNGNTTINGGIVLVKGKEVGIDSDVEHNNTFQINGGTIITSGGTMGAWDTPSSSSTQRWISVSSANNGDNGILVLDSQGDTLIVYKNATFNGSGFIDYTSTETSSMKGGIKPPPGGGPGGQSNNLVISCPQMTQGSILPSTRARIYLEGNHGMAYTKTRKPILLAPQQPSTPNKQGSVL